MVKQNGAKSAPRTRNPKKEITESYEELLKQVQEQKTEDPRQIKKTEEDRDLIQKASELSGETILNAVSQLKINIAKTLDGLTENLVDEVKKFQEVRRAAEVERKTLEELYQIKAQTDSLAALILTQQKKEEEFVKEFESKQILGVLV